MARLAGGRLDGAACADMRALPFASASAGGVLAFYSLIHLRRHELGGVLEDVRRVLRPGGRLLFSAHEGRGDVELDEFLGQRVPFAATFFELDELVTATRGAGLDVTLAERRDPYAVESQTHRLYVGAQRPR
jgi:SAM-dependent methyltransferase